MKDNSKNFCITRKRNKYLLGAVFSTFDTFGNMLTGV